MAVRPWHVAELCAGGGGLGLAVKLAVPGARGVVYVEREAAAAALLVRRMETGDLAPAPVWSDLATFDARAWRGHLHCVASGDPCQPNSNAGKRLGADDERFLAHQVLRIVDECRPLRLFRENVTGNADGQLAAFVPALEGMGYRVAAGIFSSASTANSHGRERLVIMADADGWGDGAWPDVAGDAGAGRADGIVAGSSDTLGNAAYVRGEARQRSRSRQTGARGGWSNVERTGRQLADANVARLSIGLGDQDRRGAVGQQGAAAGAGGVFGLPLIAPGPGDAGWAAVLDADPLLAPALGPVDLWAVARRRLGLPPLVDAIGRGGGMARDMDAAATAAAVAEVRRMADAMAGRVERLRLLGNGVDPMAGLDVWVLLDALHRARRRDEAGRAVLAA